jgi:hypothetical protein
VPTKAITLLKKEIQAHILFQRALFSFAPKLGQSYLLPEGVWLKMWPAFGKRIMVLVFFFHCPFENGDVPQLPFLSIACNDYIELPAVARD